MKEIGDSRNCGASNHRGFLNIVTFGLRSLVGTRGRRVGYGRLLALVVAVGLALGGGLSVTVLVLRRPGARERAGRAVTLLGERLPLLPGAQVRERDVGPDHALYTFVPRNRPYPAPGVVAFYKRGLTRLGWSSVTRDGYGEWWSEFCDLTRPGEPTVDQLLLLWRKHPGGPWLVLGLTYFIPRSADGSWGITTRPESRTTLWVSLTAVRFSPFVPPPRVRERMRGR
jgi:hypothetical protein